MTAFGDWQGLGGEIKLFPPPHYSGEPDKWEDWSWQLKSYVALYKPAAREVMELAEGAAAPITDQVVLNYQTNHIGQDVQILVFSRQLHYLLAQITEGPARLIVRLNEHGNGFESWRQLHERFSLPDRARGVSLLSQLLDFKFRDASFEADLTEFLSLKNRHEKATSRALQDDLLVTMMVNKTHGSLQQHLRLNVGDLTTFDDVLEIVKNYYQSRHLANWKHTSASNSDPAPMDIGALKGKGKYGKGKFGKGFRGKGKGKGKFGKGFHKGKGKGKMKGRGKGKGGIGKGKLKGKGKGTGCFICGSQSHWSAECPQNRQGAIVEERQQEEEDWKDWSWDWSDEGWSNADWSESDWSDWTGAVTDSSDWDDWYWYEDDWSSYWHEDWSGSADWEASTANPLPQQIPKDSASSSSATNIALAKPANTAAAVLIEDLDEDSGPPLSKENIVPSLSSSSTGHARSSRPGLVSKLFVGALMLIGTLSSSVPVCPDIGGSDFLIQNSQNLIESSGSEPAEHIDRLAEFHLQSGIVDRSWILFDSGASANCCPSWFASDYPLLPVGSDCPALRSISGKTLSILGRRVVELDCGGHSLCVQFYVCDNIPFPLVSVSRFLLQDFWTIMSRNFMALMTPTHRTVPIVRQGTLVYLTPTVIPYHSGNHSELEINCLMDELDLSSLDYELRGAQDSEDCQYDHLSKIFALIAAAKDKKKNQDYWELSESLGTLTRHHVKKRNSLFDFNVIRSDPPMEVERLTGRRETFKKYSDGSTAKIVDEDFRSLPTRSSMDAKDWTGKTTFYFNPTRIKNPRRFKEKGPLQSSKDEVLPEQSIAKPSSSDSPPAKAPLTVRIAQSRGTEESEGQILSRLRSSRSFDHSMRDDLVRLFHTPDTLTGQERTTDYWVQLPGYWIRMVHRARTDTVHPDIEPSPIQGPLGDCLMANRYTYFVWSQFPESIGHEIEDLWCPVITPDGIEKNPEEEPSRELYQAWKGFVVFATQSIELEKVEQETIDVSARPAKGLKTPGEPSISERRQHELTHLPYRDWCPLCVKAKGRHGASKKIVDRQPVIQIDYCYHATHKELPLQKILSACDVQTGLGLAVVVPSKGENEYAKAELKKFIYECGRTFGVLQYDQESPLKAIAKTVCAELGGLSVRAAPKAHPQASGSVGQMQRTLYSQLRTLLSQVEQNTGVNIDSNSALYPWAVKHSQWLLNRYLVHSDGSTSYFRRWNRNYDGGLCCFAETVQAKLPVLKFTRKADSLWETALWLGKDTEADEIIVGTSKGVHKVRTVRRHSPSQQWNPELTASLRALPWLPKATADSEGIQTTEFVLPDSLSVTGRVRPPPGLTRHSGDAQVQIENKLLEQHSGTTALPALALPTHSSEPGMTDLPEPGSKHGIDEPAESSEPKLPRLDPDSQIAESSPKARKIASVTSWIAAAIGVPSARTKDGIDVPVEVNYDSEEYREELKLSEPVIWDITREFPEDAQKIGMDREMSSMKDFNVYSEIPIEQTTKEQRDSAIDLKWVKRWKTESELRMRLVARGCFQEASKLDSDTLYASTPSLVTLRLMLTLAIARGWAISLADISTAFLHALLTEEVFVIPPVEYYPSGNCLWRLNRAMYGLKQSPQLWQSHFASVMKKLGFRRCKSDSNLYCHSSKNLYVLAYVDDLLIVGDSELQKKFLEELSKELLVKVTGHLKPDTQVSFLGRKLRHNGDSIDIFMPPDYVEDLLKIYNMQKANPAPNTGSSALKRIDDADSPLSSDDHATFRTCVGKLLWLAFVRPDISYAVKELSRDVKAPTFESLAKLKHLLRFLAGNRHSVLRLRPTETVSDWKGVMDIRCYVDSDWAGCNKTRKSTSGSIVQILGSTVVHSSRTQATVALSSGEAELYAIGQGVNEALFLKNLILEAEFARKVRIEAYTDSTAGKSMAIRFGSGKRTKHVELRYLYMQNLVQAGLLQVKKISTKLNPADLLTKYVSTETLNSLLSKLGVVSKTWNYFST